MSKSFDSSRRHGFMGDMPLSQRAKFSPCRHLSLSSKDEVEKNISVPAPLPTVTKLLPVPESLISPAEASAPGILPDTEPRSSTSSESVYYNCTEIFPSDFKQTKTKPGERCKKSGSSLDVAARCIQRNWRNFVSRKALPTNLEDSVIQIQKQRIQEHIWKLTSEMSSLKLALENEHKLHVLQMQAINTLWRKMCNWQDMSRQRNQLNDQVQQVHACIEELQRNLAHRNEPAITHEVATQTVTVAMYEPAITHEVVTQTVTDDMYEPMMTHEVAMQTDIVAVHTSDNFFFKNGQSSIPTSSDPVTQIEEKLKEDVITAPNQKQVSCELQQ